MEYNEQGSKTTPRYIRTDLKDSGVETKPKAPENQHQMIV